MRERKRFAAAGFATLTLDAGSDPGEAVRLMRGIASPVTVVGMSRAATRMRGALSARPDRIVLVSAMLDDFRASTSAATLPATLVIPTAKMAAGSRSLPASSSSGSGRAAAPGSSG